MPEYEGCVLWQTGSDNKRIHDKSVSFVSKESSKQGELFTRFEENVLLPENLVTAITPGQ
jgi:hypothetical protein